MIRAQSISDAVALSADVSMEGLTALFRSLTILAVDLLCEGFLIRGAVVRGPLFHDGQMVFGKALVDAYHFEAEVANVPRVIVVKEVREDILKGQPGLMVWLKQAEDGPMYLDVLRIVTELGRKSNSMHAKMNESDARLHKRFALIRDRLQSRFEESMDNPRHFEKIRWFSNYWNRSISGTDYQKVLGAGLEISKVPIR